MWMIEQAGDGQTIGAAAVGQETLPGTPPVRRAGVCGGGVRTPPAGFVGPNHGTGAGRSGDSRVQVTLTGDPLDDEPGGFVNDPDAIEESLRTNLARDPTRATGQGASCSV